jgi:hypothetical protein
MKKVKIKGSVFLAAVISCYIGFMNGYPLIYPDTGTYIYSGFNNLYFVDRPIFYGFFLRHISLAVSPLLVIFAQALIVCHLISLTTSMFFEGLKKNIVFLGSVLFLTFTTGYSYTVSILIPDIFTAVSLLCLINLLLNNGLTKPQTIIISILFVFSLCTHFSNILILLLLFIGIFALWGWKKLRKEHFSFKVKKILLSFFLFVSCFVLIPSVNYGIAGKFKITEGGHVFMVQHLLDVGILEDYLNVACKDKNYRICEYKDKLGWDFIWDSESPLKKTGGWEVNRQEYQRIIGEILSTPEYQVWLFRKGIEYSFKQFFTFRVTVAPPQLERSPPFGQIKWRFKDTYREYISSSQNRNELDLRFVNNLQTIVILVSLTFFFIVFSVIFFRKYLSIELKYSVVLMFSGILLNAILCSNLSTIDPRYECRVIWLLPLFTIIAVIKLYEVRNKIMIEFTNEG